MPSADTAGQIIHVHIQEVEFKLTLKPKALAKPFLEKIVEPALKAYAAKVGAKQTLTLEDIEKVMLGPGGYIRSDVIPDLSAPTASISSLLPRPRTQVGRA